MHNPFPPLFVAFARFDVVGAVDAKKQCAVVRENIPVVDAVFDLGIDVVGEFALDIDDDIDAARKLTLCLVHVWVTYSCHMAHCTSQSPDFVARHSHSAHGLVVAQ